MGKRSDRRECALRSGRGPITLCERTWQVAGFPALDAIRCPDLRSTSSADQLDLRGWRRSRTGSACATRAEYSVAGVARGRHRLIGPEVSDAVRCRDDIGAVRRERLAAGLLDESRCRLP